MDENVNSHCPSCGHENEKAAVFCSRCGSKIENRIRLLSWKWVLLSMIALVIFQILVLAVCYYLVYAIAGPEAFIRSMLVIPYPAIPSAVFTGSFIFSYFVIRSSALDIAAGMGIFLLLSNTVNFILLDAFSFYSLVWIPLIAGLAFGGAWAAKKTRFYIASRRDKKTGD